MPIECAGDAIVVLQSNKKKTTAHLRFDLCKRNDIVDLFLKVITAKFLTNAEND